MEIDIPRLHLTARKDITMYDDTPSNCVGKAITRIPRYVWVTFVSSCVLGFAVHGYMFANKLPNHDDIGHLFSSGYGVASGRWLLPHILELDGTLSMPWLIGVLSIALLAVSACFVVSVLRIKSSLNCILTAAVMVSFPTVAATFTYMFSADAYFLALLLACFAAYITNRYKFGYAGGMASIALSLGIYQSYIGFAAVLFVGILLLDALDGEIPVGKILLKGAKFLATLLFGVLLYYLIVKLTTRETELVSYMGISSMGKISISNLPDRIIGAYKELYCFYIKNGSAAHFSFMPYLLILAAVAGIYIVLLNIKTRHSSYKYTALIIVLAALYPLAGNAIFILAPDATVHLLMLYGMSGILLAAIAVSEYYSVLHCGGKIRLILGCTACWIIAVTVALSAYGYAVYSNQAYLKMDLCYRQAYSFSTRLLGAIESEDGYDVDKPVILVGTAGGSASVEPLTELDEIGMMGVMDMQDILNCYTYDRFLRYYLGASNVIYLSQTETAKDIENEDAVKNMPTYPSDGSIMVTDEFIIVKMGNLE